MPSRPFVPIAFILLVACAEAGGTQSTGATANPAEATAATATADSAPSTSIATSSTPASTTTAAPDAAPPDGMAIVTEGIFMMGGMSPENTPVHEVAVARFAMDKTEVTVEAYAGCVDAKKCKAMTKDNPFCNSLFQDRAKHPVNCIDWDDANAYCTYVGKRLPTEREWEYTAKAGPEQRPYAWGAEEPDTTRSCYMHNGGTCPVAAYAPGGFGLYDITGNVWEWTASAFVPYPGEALEGRFKVYRGGSWSRRFSKWMRNDLRNRYEVFEHSASVGFRCAKSIEPLACPKDTRASGAACVRDGAPPPTPVASALAGAGPGARPSPSAIASATTSPSASARPDEGTPVRGRAPSADADCQKNFPGAPVAYQWSGGSFQAREPLIKAAGCRKRDVGVGWSSACCPN